MAKKSLPGTLLSAYQMSSSQVMVGLSEGIMLLIDFSVPDMPKIQAGFEIAIEGLKITMIRKFKGSMLLIFGYCPGDKHIALIFDYELD